MAGEKVDPACSNAGCEKFPSENAKALGGCGCGRVGGASGAAPARGLCQHRLGAHACLPPLQGLRPPDTQRFSPWPPTAGKFITYALKMPEVRFITYSDFVRWMQVGG